MPRITLYHLSDGTFELLVEAAARRGVSPEEMAVVLLDLSVTRLKGPWGFADAHNEPADESDNE